MTSISSKRNAVFLAHNVFIRTNRRTIAMMFVHLSVCLGRSCIVIVRCTLAWIQVYGWIVQYSGHPDTKAWPPTPSHLFSSSTWNWKCVGIWMYKLGVISEERLKIEVKLLLSAKRKLHMPGVDWHNNGWPRVTLNGRFMVCQYKMMILLKELKANISASCTSSTLKSTSSTSRVISAVAELLVKWLMW